MSDKTRPCLICETPTDKFYQIGHQIFWKCAECTRLQLEMNHRPEHIPTRTDITRQPMICFNPGHSFDAEKIAIALRRHPSIAPSDMLELAACLLRHCNVYEDFSELEKAAVDIDFVAISERKALQQDSDQTPDIVPGCD